MHANSKLIFEKHAVPFFHPHQRVLEIGPDAIPSALCANVRETGSPVEFNVEGGGVMMHDPLSQKNAGRRFLGNGRSA
jgi:hypothetical protein